MANTVEGLDTLYTNLEAAKMLDEQSIELLLAAGEIIAEQERITVPVLTGALKETIRVEEIDANSVNVIAGDDDEVDYAMFVEYGTSKMPAQPYVRPAVDYSVEEIENMSVELVNRLYEDFYIE